MSFVSPDEKEIKHLYLKPRSMVYFTGEARFIWQHSISLRKIDRVENSVKARKRRISLTFRKVREGECACPYIAFCDSQKSKLTNVSSLDEFKVNIDFNNNINNIGKPTDIEKKHVYDVYDKIAPHFSHTRYKPWPKVAEYIEKLKSGTLNADIGCGNGKYLNVRDQDVYTIGTDRSINLISICKDKDKKNQVFAADSLKLPFRSYIFDSAISIAVVHHFSTPDLRLHAIKEIIRILTVEGTLLIYVWALEQEGKQFKQQDNFVPWHLQNNYDDNKTIETLGPEIIKEDKKNSTVYHRYYHMFKKDELEGLLLQIDNIVILESYYDHANWCCIIKKTK